VTPAGEKFCEILRQLTGISSSITGVKTRTEPFLDPAQNFLTRSVTSRPLKGNTPTVDLVLGYKKSNKSPILKLLLLRLDELVARVLKREKA
jgi:hypothetical protein